MVGLEGVFKDEVTEAEALTGRDPGGAGGGAGAGAAGQMSGGRFS